MGWTLRALGLAAAVCAAGLFSAEAQEKKATDIKGGITGKVKSVDPEKGTLTLTTTDGRTRTFTIDDSTTMAGPRGGQVPRRLKDPRFHEGLEVTIVASGNTAKEVHLGYDRKPREDQPAKPAPAKAKALPPEPQPERPEPQRTTPPTKTKPVATPPAPAKKAADEEFTGKVKSVDPEKRLLVVTLSDGKDKSFILATATPVQVKGKAAKGGLSDATIKPGASVTVITEPGGRKVKEVNVTPASGTRKAA